MKKFLSLIAVSLLIAVSIPAQYFQGTTTFSIPSYITTCVGELEDLNADTVPDLIVPGFTSSFGPAFKVIDGSTGAVLASAPAIGVGTSWAFFPGALADLNTDGFMDYVQPIYETTTSTMYVAVFLGTGGGNFATPVTFSCPSASVLRCRRLDFDGDGLSDIVFFGHTLSGLGTAFSAKWSGGSLAIVDYSSTINSPYTITDVTWVASQPMVDTYGYRWLVFTTDVGYLYQIESTGTLTTSANIPLAYVPVGAEVADFDADGLFDVVACGASGGSHIIFCDQYVAETHRASSQFGTTLNLNGIVVADFDSDGIPEIAVVDTSVSPADLIYTPDTGGSFFTYSLSNNTTLGFGGVYQTISAAKNGRPALVIPLLDSANNSYKVDVVELGGVINANPSSTGWGVGVEPLDGWINRQPAIGDSEMSFIMANGLPSASAIVGIGYTLYNPPVPLTPYFTAYTLPLTYSSAVTVNANGFAAVNYGIPNNSALIGVRLVCQWLSVDSMSNVIGSNGIDLTLGYTY